MNFRDIELLSAYLDGQLNPSDLARLETRLSSDPSLRAVVDDLRAARSLLRQLPARKAPRNFTLTRKMVGLKPPLPRSYSTFRFATVLAALLLFATFALNGIAPRLTFGAAAPAAPAYGMGGGCDNCNGEFESLEAPATEAPAAAEAPAVEPSLDTQSSPTIMPTSTEETARIAETPSAKTGESEGQDQVPSRGFVPASLQVGLAVFILLSGLTAFLMRQSAKRKWQ